MKKLMCMLLSVILIIGLASCGNNSDPTSSKAGEESSKVEESSKDEKSSKVEESSKDQEASKTAEGDGDGYTIAISMNALDEYQTLWLGAFTEYAESRGHKVVTTNAESSVDKQLSDVDALIQTKPDIILIRSTDVEGVAPAFEAVVKAGIPCIDSDMQTSYTGEGVLHLTTGQLIHGQNQALWCIDYLEKNPDATIKAGYVWGAQGNQAVQDRYDGWVNDMKASDVSDRFELLVEKVCNWSANETMAAVEDWMLAYPEMNVIVAASDEMAIAAINVIEANNRTGEVFVLGIDGSTNAQEHIREGLLAGSSYTPTIKLAQLTVEYAERVCGGETDLYGEYVDMGTGLVQLMTKDNIDEVLAS